MKNFFKLNDRFGKRGAGTGSLDNFSNSVTP
jgi:hypothetical protein